MKSLMKNPLTLWFRSLIKSKKLAYKFREKNLEIGYFSNVLQCSFGKYNTIYDNVNLNEVELGDFTYVSDSTNISKTKIGKFCSIGHDCKIGLGKHPSSTFVSTHPIFFSDLKQVEVSFADKSYFNESENISIGNDVWIGDNVMVCDGVNICDGVIVAVGSVVTKNIPPYAIVGGVPAKVIKYRFNENEIEKLLNLKWWDMNIDYLKSNFTKFHNIEVFLNANKSSY